MMGQPWVALMLAWGPCVEQPNTCCELRLSVQASARSKTWLEFMAEFPVANFSTSVSFSFPCIAQARPMLELSNSISLLISLRK